MIVLASCIVKQEGMHMQELLASLLTNLDEMLSTLTTQGFKPLEDLYLQAWLHTGQQARAKLCLLSISTNHTTMHCMLSKAENRLQLCCTQLLVTDRHAARCNREVAHACVIHVTRRLCGREHTDTTDATEADATVI